MSEAIVEREPIKVLMDILISEMSLEASQVIVYNERFEIPKIPGLFIVLMLADPGKIIGNNSKVEEIEGVTTEVQRLRIISQIQIDVMSVNEEARQRCFEIPMALHSSYGQEKCQYYNIKIAKIPGNFLDVSEVEETARLNRYTATFPVEVEYVKVKGAEHYSKFPNSKVFEPSVVFDKLPEA